MLFPRITNRDILIQDVKERVPRSMARVDIHNLDMWARLPEQSGFRSAQLAAELGISQLRRRLSRGDNFVKDWLFSPISLLETTCDMDTCDMDYG